MVRGAGLILLLWLFLGGEQLQAASALWDLNPASGNWNDPLNWSPNSVPNGPADNATFGISKMTTVFLSANTEVDGIVFNAVASAYTVTARPNFTLTFSGTGITNNSGIAENFIADVDGSGNSGTILFTQNASAGSLTQFTSHGRRVTTTSLGVYGGTILFRDHSNAGSGAFAVGGGAFAAAAGGFTGFYNNASAANGNFMIEGGAGRLASGGRTEFHDNSTAGNAQFLNQGSAFNDPDSVGGVGARMSFHESATAGNATITNEASRVGDATGAGGARLVFYDNASAGSSQITNNGGFVLNSAPAGTGFLGNSTAAESTIVNNGSRGGTYGGSRTGFSDTATAGNATLIANGGTFGGEGGTIQFSDDSDGGTARIQLHGNGNLDISAHSAAAVTIGSLAGDGIAYLGARTLAVGSNNLNTTFSGTLRDGGYPGGPGGTGGSLIKTGNGSLTLSGTNTYTGATTVDGGTLAVNGSVVSATTVNGGTLGGSGAVRAIVVNSGGTLSPGDGVGILNVVGNLTLSLGATYLVDLNGTAVGKQYDQTNVTGLVALGNATLSLRLGFAPTAGDQFTIINNDGGDAVTGTFLGLPQGALIPAAGGIFAISYAGGDGNDVVLTSVVPEPATWVLLSAGIGFLAGSLRRRRCILSYPNLPGWPSKSPRTRLLVR